MLKYCEICGKEVDTKVITKKEKYKVCGEDVEVEAQVLVCIECGEEFYCEELDNATLMNAYNEYRRRHKLLFPEDIKKIREQYGLSQRSFAKLLNWGDKTICRYENGSIQDKAHNSLLLFLREPVNMMTYLTENDIVIEQRKKDKLLATVNKLEQDRDYRINSHFFDVFFSRIPCEENGYKSFDYEKLCAMVLFYANKKNELLKTKLMKLLNYSDMLYYKENGTSISGMKYANLPYGPVPDHFELILEMMEEDHIIHVDVFCDGSYEKCKIVAERKVPKGVLSDTEMKVLKRIYEKFKDFGAAEISEYSHKEIGYKTMKPGEYISYAYAKDIHLD